MNRRTCLHALAGIGSQLMFSPRWLMAADTEVEINPSNPGPEISPHVYGHFIEHLGGVIYDGIWVGKQSRIANIEGVRRRFVDDMKQLAAPNIRWPGGCFADGYHWRDGVGPVEKRPRTATYWGNEAPPALHGAEPNWFGTQEFLRLCRAIGATPYLAANMATGSPQEFHDWLSYCNAPAGTVSLADERKANGDAEPFAVKYWGIGNEVWGCGGNMKPAEYISWYKRFVTQLPPGDSLYLVACGPRGHSRNSDVEWTQGIFEALAGDRRVKMSALSMHFYTDFRPTDVPSDQSTPEQWYAVLKEGTRIETAILENWAVMSRYDPQHRLKFVVDEWGPWYSHNPKFVPGFQLVQSVTLRDAAVSAMHFDIFNRHADKIAMANVAQTINCLNSLFLAHEDKYVRTPVYHVFAMYKPHMGAASLPVKIQNGDLRVTSTKGQVTLPQLSASASLQGKRLTVTLTNPSAQDAVSVRLRLTGSFRPTEGNGIVLTHADPAATNTFSKPEEVKPVSLAVNISGNAAAVLLPKQSIARVQLELA